MNKNENDKSQINVISHIYLKLVYIFWKTNNMVRNVAVWYMNRYLVFSSLQAIGWFLFLLSIIKYRKMTKKIETATQYYPFIVFAIPQNFCLFYVELNLLDGWFYSWWPRSLLFFIYFLYIFPIYIFMMYLSECIFHMYKILCLRQNILQCYPHKNQNRMDAKIDRI